MERIKKDLKQLEEKGQLRVIPNITTKSGNSIIIDNKEYINFASNDYLNISTDNDLRKEFITSTELSFSSASARLLSGTSDEYKQLETLLAELYNKEASIIFNTGYQCNLGIISSLCQKGDVVFSDKLNHASIVDGMKLADGDFIRYNHLDYNQLEEILRKKRGLYKRAIIVSESIFSMDGDIADIDRLIELKNKYDCLLMIDEAHAFCTTGKNLAGVVQYKDVDIITATFGKAVGSFGAFCVADKHIISYLTNKARSFIFSTSIPPINIAWTYWLLTQKREYLICQAVKLNKLTTEAHKIFQNTTSSSHIIPIIIGSNSQTIRVSEKLRNLGYYVPAIRPPTVPEGSSRLRLSLTANSEIKDIINISRIILES